MKLNLSLHEASSLLRYIESALLSDAKTIDKVKEYFLAKSLQGVQFKIEQAILKHRIKQATKSTVNVQLNEFEIISLSVYFNRYETINFLKPVEFTVMQITRASSVLVDVLR